MRDLTGGELINVSAASGSASSKSSKSSSKSSKSGDPSNGLLSLILGIIGGITVGGAILCAAWDLFCDGEGGGDPT